jgi:hypothetical protein
MRQYQLLDVGIRGDGSDDGRRHMEAPFQTGRVSRSGVMSDEYVRVRPSWVRPSPSRLCLR